MALTFPNVSLLGLTQESRFFGAGFEYGTFRRLTVQGLVLDLTATWGITGIWTGQEGILATVRNNHDYQALSLNGVDFGSGRIEGITFTPGLDVRLKEYTANITVFDSGNLFNLTGTFYGGIDTTNFQYLESFAEDYAFTKKPNGGYAYTHDMSVKFTSGVGQLNSIGAAQGLARSLFTGSNLGLAFYSGYTNKQGKRYVTESYDLISNACSFQTRFDFDNDNGAYSAIRTNSVDLDEQGVVTATERGTIRGIENPNYQRALSAVGIELTGAYYRCSGVAAAYFPSGALLLNSLLTQGRDIDIFNNVIGYTAVFNNKPGNSGTYFWDYTQQISRDQNIYTVTENGTVVGRAANKTEAFSAAQGGFAVVKPGIQPRAAQFFLVTVGSATNHLESKRETNAPYQGQISYAYQFSNDPALVADSGIRRVEVTQQDNVSIYAYTKLGIFNVKEIAQDDHQSTVGSTLITVDMQGDKTVTLSNYLTTALATINANIPGGNDRYVGDAGYSYNPNDGSLNTRLTWLYNQPAVKTLYP